MTAFTSATRRRRRRLLLFATALAALAAALLPAPAGARSSADGSGTMTYAPTAFLTGATGQTVTFTFTAASPMVNGALELTVPIGWTAPQTGAPAGAGHVTAAAGTASVSGRLINVTGLNLGVGASFDIVYGNRGSGGSGVTAPGAGSWYFQLRERDTAGGTLTVAAGSPTVGVYGPDGKGTMAVSPASLPAGQANAKLTFAFTAASGGIGGGAVRVYVPSPWPAPSVNGADGSYVAAGAGVVTVSGRFAIVSGVTLAGGQTLTIAYGDRSLGGPGVTVPATLGGLEFSTYAKAVATSSFTLIDSSPWVTVTGDTIAPTVTGVSAVSPNGAYRANAAITLAVAFSEPVTVIGSPTLMLETGAVDGVAGYISGSGTSTLLFGYLVQPGDTAAHLDYTGPAALMVVGGSIRDAAANDADRALAVPGSPGSLGAAAAIVVDTDVPAGGALVVNGTAATGGGSVSTSTTGAYTVDVRNDWTDAGSGIAESLLTRADAPLLPGGTCGAFGAQVMLIGAPSQVGLADGCYRYRLLGSDLAGNTTWIATTVTVSAAPPTLLLPAAVSALAGAPAGTTVVYGASAVDAAGFAVPVSCWPASGSAFPLGTTNVSCSAVDAGGRTANGSFAVTVHVVVLVTTPPAETGSQVAPLSWASLAFTRSTCSLDGAPYAPCSSPRVYHGLAAGPHTFCVKGTADVVPSCTAWTVVSPGKPVVSILAVATSGSDAVATFAADQAGVRFGCSLDGAAWKTCSSPLAFHGLARDGHVLAVRATNFAGDTSDVPAVQPFAIG